jgi:hypothetical protein
LVAVCWKQGANAVANERKTAICGVANRSEEGRIVLHRAQLLIGAVTRACSQAKRFVLGVRSLCA